MNSSLTFSWADVGDSAIWASRLREPIATAHFHAESNQRRTPDPDSIDQSTPHPGTILGRCRCRPIVDCDQFASEFDTNVNLGESITCRITGTSSDSSSDPLRLTRSQRAHDSFSFRTTAAALWCKPFAYRLGHIRRSIASRHTTESIRLSL